jgi:hypothetical protein
MVNAIMNLCPCPHVTVLELFKNINLSGSIRSCIFPSAPVPVIVEIILSWADLKNPISGYGPGKLIFEGAHFWIFYLLLKDHEDIKYA